MRNHSLSPIRVIVFSSWALCFVFGLGVIRTLISAPNLPGANAKPGQSAFPVGASIVLPKADAFLKPLPPDVFLVQMPDCTSCSMKQVDLSALGRLKRVNEILLIFPNSRDGVLRQVGRSRLAKFLVLFDDRHDVIPAQALVFAPFSLTLDKSRTVTRTEPADKNVTDFAAQVLQ